MSDYLATTGAPREFKSHRLQLSVSVVQRFDELPGKPTLSRLMNELLLSYVVDQELKQLLKDK